MMGAATEKARLPRFSLVLGIESIHISKLRLPNGLKCNLKCFVVGMGNKVHKVANI